MGLTRNEKRMEYIYMSLNEGDSTEQSVVASVIDKKIEEARAKQGCGIK